MTDKKIAMARAEASMQTGHENSQPGVEKSRLGRLRALASGASASLPDAVKKALIAKVGALPPHNLVHLMYSIHLRKDVPTLFISL
jgi:hypothetical protein